MDAAVCEEQGSVRGTGCWDLGTPCLSASPYHMEGRGTCLRTNSSPANSVCPRTRTTYSPRRCGTCLRTEQVPTSSPFVSEPVPHASGGRVVRVSGQTTPGHPVFVRRPVPHAGERYVFQDRHRCHQCLSQNTYHMEGRGTCLRTNGPSANSVCLQSRTTWARRRCGTCLRTEQVPTSSPFVSEPVPHASGGRVVRVSGQTAPGHLVFVLRHVPHEGERYVFVDKLLSHQRLSQNPYPSHQRTRVSTPVRMSPDSGPCRPQALRIR